MTKVVFQRAFQELTDAEIAEIMERAGRVTFPSNTRIFREGQENDIIFVVLDGTIRVVRYERDGREVRLSAPLGPGDTFGEMSFIDRLGTSATLVANSDVTVRSIDHPLVENMARAHEGFGERFYHSLALTLVRRLRRADAILAGPS